MSHRLSLDHIAAALDIIDPVFLHTPQYRAEALEAILGCQLVLKVETVNPIRSFKGRGASYLVSRLPAGSTVVCASAGNLGQAMAYACRARDVRLLAKLTRSVIVYASVHANPLKLARMEALGAEVRLDGDDFDAAKQEARRVAQANGIRLVEDSLAPETGEGAGTIGLELLRWPEPLDAILVALGNGALLTGVGRWVKAHAPQTRIIGVVAAGAPAMADSWQAGRLVSYAQCQTIADGIAVRVPIPEVLEDMRDTVDDVLRVDDASLIEGMQLLHAHAGLVVEPSGAAGVAAIWEQRERFAGQRVATVICGGNLTPEQIRQWLA